MNYSSRIHLILRNKDDIEKLYDIDISQYGFDCDIEDIFEKGKTDIIVDNDWSVSEIDLEDFVNEIVDRVSDDCVIISDTLLSDESMYFYVCYFGDSVFSDNIDCSLKSIFPGDVKDFMKWVDFLESVGIDLSEMEKCYLRELNLIY